MKRMIGASFVLAGVLTLGAGCEDQKQPEASAPASAPAERPAAEPQAATVPVPADFAAEAESSITEENYEEALQGITTELEN